MASRFCLSSLRRPAAAASVTALCIWCLAATVCAAAVDPVGAWQQRLAQVESTLRRLPASDITARKDLARDLAQLRQEVTTWLAAFPPVQREGQPRLAAPGTTTTVEELAAEISRLRAAISRIGAALA